MPSTPRIPFVLVFLAFVAFLGADLFVIAPWATTNWGDGWGNVVFNVLRMVSLLTFAILATGLYLRSRVQTLSSTAFLEFVDQGVFRSLWIVRDFKKNPEAWAGVPFDGALFSVFFSYMIYLPIILVIAFAGYELGLVVLKQRRVRGKLAS